MKITKQVCWIDSHGNAHTNLERCQMAEINHLLEASDITEHEHVEASNFIVLHAKEIIDILTLSDSSRPAARGKAKPRRKDKGPDPFPVPGLTPTDLANIVS